MRDGVTAKLAAQWRSARSGRSGERSGLLDHAGSSRMLSLSRRRQTDHESRAPLEKKQGVPECRGGTSWRARAKVYREFVKAT